MRPAGDMSPDASAKFKGVFSVSFPACGKRVSTLTASVLRRFHAHDQYRIVSKTVRMCVMRIRTIRKRIKCLEERLDSWIDLQDRILSKVRILSAIKMVGVVGWLVD
jgi:hypothetical protein